MDEGPAERGPLLHPPGELVRVVILKAADADEIHQFLDGPAEAARVLPAPGEKMIV